MTTHRLPRALTVLDGGLAGRDDPTTDGAVEPADGPPRARGRSRYLLLFGLVVGLNAFGLVMVLSASSVVGATTEGSSWSYFNRQVMWLALGIVVLGVVVGIPYHRWRALAPFAYAAAIGLLVAVAVPRFGVSVNGARRWIQVGPQRFQPSEVAKLALLLLTASVLAARMHCMRDHRRSLNPILLATAPVIGLIMLQPDLGTSLIVVAVVGSMLIAAGVPAWPLARIGAVVGVVAVLAALAAPYRRARVMAFLDPWSDPQGITYQTLQSLVGLADGGLGGVGLGESRAKWGFLPNAHTDFIYAVVGEELGLLGALAVLVAFVLLGVLGYGVALRCSDPFGTLLAVGVTTWLLVQAFVNMGGVVGLLPITGVTLPFVSFGGTSLLVNMLAAGMLLNVARHAR